MPVHPNPNPNNRSSVSETGPVKRSTVTTSKLRPLDGDQAFPMEYLKEVHALMRETNDKMHYLNAQNKQLLSLTDVLQERLDRHSQKIEALELRIIEQDLKFNKQMYDMNVLCTCRLNTVNAGLHCRLDAVEARVLSDGSWMDDVDKWIASRNRLPRG